MSRILALYSSSFENLIIVGDFNACMKDFSMSVSCDKESLIKDAASSKTNSFDFHRMAVTSIKIFFKRLNSKGYSSKQLFWEELLYELWKVISEKNANAVEEFIEIC